MPGEASRLVRTAPASFCGQECRTNNEDRDAKNTGRIEPEGHSGDIVSSGFARQHECEDGIEQVTNQNSNGRSGDHGPNNEVRRHPKGSNQERNGQDEAREIIEQQPEICVDITRGVPTIALIRPHESPTQNASNRVIQNRVEASKGGAGVNDFPHFSAVQVFRCDKLGKTASIL